jgi:RNA-splicing ligase RtcB|nr:MAG TPA: tRNA-splicing ligase RtcB [Caudoviricetes sp.]
MEKAVEVCGKYTSAKIFTHDYDERSFQQIKEFCDNPAAAGNKVRIMPDVHAGAGCVIGFTAEYTDKIVPHVIGVDIGCGMLAVDLGMRDIDLDELDRLIRERIPAGFNVHDEPTMSTGILDGLCCRDKLHNIDRIERSVGTLGGGNHFIELDVDDEGRKYLVIHTGSRNLGKQVADYYQNLAISNLKGKNKTAEEKKELIRKLSAEGRQKDIAEALKAIKHDSSEEIPDHLCYLEGQDMKEYLGDMGLCQYVASLNRGKILLSILGGLSLLNIYQDSSVFETIHNYIDSHGIIRKGAVSAKAGEKLLIPLNMRDGSLICIGKGNPDWNFSAPHGAGRLYSRKKARETFSVEEYRKQMNGIFTTSADASTLDECPMAYKPADEIIEAIGSTAEIVKRIRPIYNFKAGGE